ncbi:MAG: C4-type zinc ribbon domain-containing protein [Pseudomonadota bacterium]
MTDFQTQLENLKHLQEIDIRLDKLMREIEILPQRIASAKTAFEEVKSIFDNNSNELAEAEKSRRQEELDLKTSQEDLKHKEAKMYAIKTNKEYQAVLKEIADTKKLNKDREDNILAFMEKIEELTKKNEQLSQELADKQAAFEKENDLLKADEEEFKKQIAENKKTRPEIEAKVDKTVLRKYDFIRQRYRNALVYIKNGVCQGCSMNIPAQLFNEMLRFKELKNCPSCNRLIYVYIEEKKEE